MAACTHQKTIPTKCADFYDGKPYVITNEVTDPCLVIDDHRLCEIYFDKPGRTERRKVRLTDRKDRVAFNDFNETFGKEELCRLAMKVTMNGQTFSCHYDRRTKDFVIFCFDK